MKEDHASISILDGRYVAKLLVQAIESNVDDGTWTTRDVQKITKSLMSEARKQTINPIEQIVDEFLDSPNAILPLLREQATLPQGPSDSGLAFVAHINHVHHSGQMIKPFWEEPAFSLGTLRDKGANMEINLGLDVHWKPTEKLRSGCSAEKYYLQEEMALHDRATARVLKSLPFGCTVVLGACAEKKIHAMMNSGQKALSIPIDGYSSKGHAPCLKVTFDFVEDRLRRIYLFVAHPGVFYRQRLMNPAIAQMIDMTVSFALWLNGQHYVRDFYLNLSVRCSAQYSLFRLQHYSEKEAETLQNQGRPLTKPEISPDFLQWADGRLRLIELDSERLFAQGKSVIELLKLMSKESSQKLLDTLGKRVAISQMLLPLYDDSDITKQLKSVPGIIQLKSSSSKSRAALKAKLAQNTQERWESMGQQLLQGTYIVQAQAAKSMIQLCGYQLSIKPIFFDATRAQKERGVQSVSRARVLCELTPIGQAHQHAVLYSSREDIKTEELFHPPDLPQHISDVERVSRMSPLFTQEDRDFMSFLLTSPSNTERMQKYGGIFTNPGQLRKDSGMLKVLFALDNEGNALIPHHLRITFLNTRPYDEYTRDQWDQYNYTLAALNEPAARLGIRLTALSSTGKDLRQMWFRSQWKPGGASLVMLCRLNRIVDFLDGRSAAWSVQQPHRAILHRGGRHTITVCGVQGCLAGCDTVSKHSQAAPSVTARSQAQSDESEIDQEDEDALIAALTSLD